MNTPSLVTHSIPDELLTSQRAVVWNAEVRDGKPTKVPYAATTPTRRASVTDPTTWASFADALEAVEDGKADGVGVVLGDGLAGVDLDGCRDPETGRITDNALAIVQVIDSYTEVSPSGTGLKVFARGTLPAGRRRKSGLEMYDGGRYFTVTGIHLDGTPTTIEERTPELASLHARMFGRKGHATHLGEFESAPNGDERAFVARATRASNGRKFEALWDGTWEPTYHSQSEADLALCNLLAFWTSGDATEIDRLFRQSGLMRPKWDQRHFADGRTYGEETISKAVTGSRDVYRANRDAPGEIQTRPATTGADHVIDARDYDLPRISAKALRALQAANEPPRLFRYGGLPVRVERDETDRPVLQRLSDDRLRHELARAARWIKYTKNGEEPALPPRHVAADLLASPHLEIPRLTAIIRAPTFLPDGTLHEDPGYHPAGGTYYAPPFDFSVPEVPRRPSGNDILRARELIVEELLREFPFVDDPERAHAVALLLLPFVRDLIAGPTPLHLIEKPAPGTGGSLLAAMLLLPSSGDHLTAMTEGRDEDEWRKHITARLRSSPTAVLIDNLRRRLDSSALAAAITAAVHEDRILGTSDTVRLPVRCAWIATGNNPALSAELTRRAVRIRLDARRDRPWLRSGFRHPDLPTWAAAHRGDLVWAALVLGRAWIVAGRPHGTPTLGMFEGWSRVLGGILDVAGIPGFLGNLGNFYEESDAEGATWRAFVQAWWEKHGDEEVGVAELWAIADPIDLALGDGTDRSQKTRLGKRLTQMRDRQFNDLRLVRGGEWKGAQRWRLVNVR